MIQIKSTAPVVGIGSGAFPIVRSLTRNTTLLSPVCSFIITKMFPICKCFVGLWRVWSVVNKSLTTRSIAKNAYTNLIFRRFLHLFHHS
nr:MAG TPA: hypothetical protein [Caudoviricetes sp.]